MGNNRAAIALMWSKSFLTSRPILWALFWVNALGTAYGFYWYGEQLQTTAAEKPFWMVLFVPDSPTASMFFTLAIAWMLVTRRTSQEEPCTFRPTSIVRGLVETIGAVTSFKYGIWAVWMIVWGGLQGDAIVWQDWMLSISHLGMAAEALVFARFFRIRPLYVYAAAIWALGNDYVDYHFGIYPWLPDELADDLSAIRIGTILLSLTSCLVFASFVRRRMVDRQAV
ncbi:MAG: DUF1405 domain-containing protein [Paenibacillaceae bacterium]|nr:DUF1405 domain-containing protein [Paenibacillaceae bacterium]